MNVRKFLLAGLAAIGVTFFLVLKVATGKEAKIIVAIVGSVGSILVNYIAAIDLKMHASASTNLASFHTRLVETSQILLGNLLASRIENENKRWETLSQLSIELVKKVRETSNKTFYERHVKTEFPKSLASRLLK